MSTPITMQGTVPPLHCLKCPLLLKLAILLTLTTEYIVKRQHLGPTVSTLIQKIDGQERQHYFICNLKAN